MSDTKATTSHSDLAIHAQEVLHRNDRTTHTVPSAYLYPHQWLWDSCFIAIGLRWLDVDRAQTELESLLRGQWSTGMLPHMILSDKPDFKRDHDIWRSWLSPYSPDTVATSGITQPPMLAEAVWQVGSRLQAAERRRWFAHMLPPLIAYHTWLYQDRDPHQEGLVLQIHPWETGLDNTPPWMHELHEHRMPTWVRTVRATHADLLFNFFRRDLRYAPPGERFSTLEVLTLYDAQRRLRRKLYDTNQILDHGLFAIEDLTFNCILIRANTRLSAMAKFASLDLPDSLRACMHKSEQALESLWDEYSGVYWSRDFVTHELLKIPSIATLLPLYAGCISAERAAKLVTLLENDQKFGPTYPVPSVPLDSPDFSPVRYWQGPVWMNMNWLIMDGLRRYGFTDHVAALKETSLEMITNSGFAEYFDPNTGEALGADSFSWTAALTLDLLHR